MRNYHYLFVFMIISTFLIPSAFSAKEAPKQEAILIDTYHIDVTGDGEEDTIELKGILFSDDSSYYRNIWMEVTDKQQKNDWTIQLGSGYDPELQFVDLTHNEIKDVLYQSATGGSGGLYNYELHSFAGGQHEQLELPVQPYVKGQFLDNFQVEIDISPMADPIIMDVSDRKDEYISLGLYKEDGKLTAATPVMVDPIAFYEPVLLSESNGYGLKSYQQISGADHADGLGTIETVWYVEDGEWVVVKTDWLPSSIRLK